MGSAKLSGFGNACGPPSTTGADRRAVEGGAALERPAAPDALPADPVTGVDVDACDVRDAHEASGKGMSAVQLRRTVWRRGARVR